MGKKQKPKRKGKKNKELTISLITMLIGLMTAIINLVTALIRNLE